jgi:hypothetical protein
MITLSHFLSLSVSYNYFKEKKLTYLSPINVAALPLWLHRWRRWCLAWRLLQLLLPPLFLRRKGLERGRAEWRRPERPLAAF